jgi:hypothetical protein
MKKLTFLIISIIVLLIVIQRFSCNNVKPVSPSVKDTVIVVDTVWRQYDSIVYKKVTVKTVIHDTLPPEYLPDPMYDSLKVQYNELAIEFLAKKIYTDTFKIPQIAGTFIITDTIKNNRFVGRQWATNYTIPSITKTVTVTKEAPQTRQIYVGGGLAMNGSYNGAGQLGLIYKDRKDRLIGTYIGMAPGQRMLYGVQSYWKIKLKK